MSIGQRIKEATSANPELKAREIAAHCGVSVQAVYKWQKGEVSEKMDPSNLFSISEITGFSPKWIATGKGDKFQQKEDERTKRLIALYGQLDDRGRDAVFRVAEAESKYSVDSEQIKSEAA